MFLGITENKKRKERNLMWDEVTPKEID